MNGLQARSEPARGFVTPAAIRFDERADFHLKLKGIHNFLAIGWYGMNWI